LKPYAASLKVAGSIPGEIIVCFFFNLHNLSSRAMALGLSQPLTEMSTRNLPGVKRCRSVRLTSYLPSVSQWSRKCGILNISQTYGPPRPVSGIALPFLRSRNTSASVEMGLELEGQGSILILSYFLSSPQRSFWLLGPPSLLPNGHQDDFA
jgi:hypothetical protein